MKAKNKIMAVFLVLCMLCFAFYQGVRSTDTDTQLQGQESVQDTVEKDTLYVWYTDETLTDYINSKALEYTQLHEDVRVVPMLVSAVEYLEGINDATMNTTVFPDLYITSNDTLEKAYLAGLASEITDPQHLVNTETYPQTAIDAVTYDGKQAAYPFYYETSLFLYNRTYLESMAQTKAEALAAQAEGEAAQAMADALAAAGEEPEDELTEEALAADEVQTVSGADGLIPQTFDDILNLADEYDAPEGVESILKWDVSDIFYNYFFAGNYINIGGPAGDDASVTDICNEQSVACMNVYQSLNQFFSIEAKESDYASVLQEFIEGKSIFTVATSDAVEKLETAKAEGSFLWEYGIAPLPDVTGELKSRGLSVTNAVVVNGFSSCREEANAFASYLAAQTDSSLYERTGKVAASRQVAYENADIMRCVSQAYEKSTSLPKLMQASNFWVQLEVAYTDIWSGGDAAATMQQLEEQMRRQIQ